MTRLARVQDLFQAHLLNGAPEAEPLVVGDARADAATRLEVYYQAYRLRLIEILRNDFDGLLGVLGDAGFDAMAQAYLQSHPSTQASVRWFGRHLPVFLATTVPYRDRPELAEMAAFEWAWGQAFDAADAALVTEADLGNIAPGQWADMQIGLHPSLQRLTLAWNVPEIFGAICRAEDPPVPAQRSPAVDWLLWRKQLQVSWRSLAADESAALAAAAGGASFAALCEGLCDWHDADEVPMRAAMLLKTWLAEGLVTALATA